MRGLGTPAGTPGTAIQNVWRPATESLKLEASSLAAQILQSTDSDGDLMAANQASPTALAEVPRDYDTAITVERSLHLKSFTSDDAFALGSRIRSRIQELHPQIPALVLIQLHGSPTFLATTAPGVQADNHDWAARKIRTVNRWGCSSWAMRRKFTPNISSFGEAPVDLPADEAWFVDKFSLGERAGEYALHGGAVPLRVDGVEGHIGVAVVSGLKQHEDHMVVVEGLQWLSRQGAEQQNTSVVPQPAT